MSTLYNVHNIIEHIQNPKSTTTVTTNKLGLDQLSCATMCCLHKHMYLQQDDQRGEKKKIEDEEDSNTSNNNTSTNYSDMNNSTANSDTRDDSGISENQDMTNMDIYSNTQNIGQVSRNPLTCILKF